MIDGSSIRHKERAKVVNCDGDYVWLEPIETSGCSTCEVNSGCGTGLLSRVFRRKALTVCVPTSMSLSLGDEVWISIPHAVLLRASLVLYCIPLIGLLVGAGLSQALFPTYEPFVVLLTGCLFLISFFFARQISSELEKKSITQIKVLGKCIDNIVLQIG